MLQNLKTDKVKELLKEDTIPIQEPHEIAEKLEFNLSTEVHHL